MRFLAFMLLLIGGAAAGAAWQGYGWEELRCSIEESRWGCEEKAYVAPSERDADRDQVRCGELDVASPRDKAEGLWFLATCVEPEELARLVEEQEAADQLLVEEDLPLLYGIGDRSWCKFYLHTATDSMPEEVFEPEGEFSWFNVVCQGVEPPDDIPTYCPFSDPGVCDGMAQTIGLRATTDIPASTRFTPAVVELVSIPLKAYEGAYALPEWTLGAVARKDIPAGEILLQIMLCSYAGGCPELPEVEANRPD